MGHFGLNERKSVIMTPLCFQRSSGGGISPKLKVTYLGKKPKDLPKSLMFS